METMQIVSWLYDKAARAMDHSYARMLNMTAKRLRELDEKQRWIPVTERLPDGECIAIGFQNEMLIGWVAEDIFSDTGYLAESEGEILGNVTHWMPLPEPPKQTIIKEDN